MLGLGRLAVGVGMLQTRVLADSAIPTADPTATGRGAQPGHWWSIWPDTFLAPGRLWMLLIVPVLLGVYLWRQVRRRRYAVRFSAAPLLAGLAPRRAGWRRHVVAAGLLASLVVFFIGFARPAGMVAEPRDRATVVLAIDVSLSMQATDVSPTRMAAAQEAARDFAAQLPAGMNLGLVSFSGSASVLVPPTTDRSKVVAGIDALELGPYTGIGEGIYTSLAALKLAPKGADGSMPPAHIVLLSDGETTAGMSNEQASLLAKEAKVPVSTIAFGTPTGTVTMEGVTEVVPVNEDELRSIATATGGKFYQAKTLDQLTNVYDTIRRSIGYEMVPAEITDRWVGVALIMLLGSVIGSLGWFGRLP